MKQNKRYAIAGSIASGKSLLGNILRKLGYPVIDSDQIARDVVAKGSQGERLLREHFPETFFANELDRKRLAAIIFSDEEKRQLLNSLLHPLILKESERLLSEQKGIVFYEAPLLFEAAREGDFQGVLWVDAPLELRLQRLMKRDQIDRDDALQKLSKFRKPEFLFRAVFWNQGIEEEMKGLVKQLLVELKESI